MPKRPHRLLAKVAGTPDTPVHAETLLGHTEAVFSAAEVLLECRGLASLSATGFDAANLERLTRIVKLAAFMHDLGKCSDHFQAMIRKERTVRQLVRHEALTFWLCWPGGPLAKWLHPAVDTDLDYMIAVLTAAGHHRKFWERALAPDDAGAGNKTIMFVAHDDFQDVLRFGAQKLGLAESPLFESDLIFESTWRIRPERFFEACEEEWGAVSNNPEARILPICKAIVIDADVAGSALPPAGETSLWISKKLTQRASAEELMSVATRGLKGEAPRPFQLAIGASTSPITLVLAGCGTGKTVAAYMWIAKQHAGRQLWFTYPTTNTTTEGFRDYGPHVVKGRLEHSRAKVDVRLFSNIKDDVEEGEERDRLDSIQAWGAHVMTCTVDTVLGIIQNQRKGLYAWPGLVDSVIVFDEIHAYDNDLFGALLRFLERFPGIPVLLMSAGVQEHRLLALRALCERAHHQPLNAFQGPEDFETLPRHLIRVSNEIEAWKEAEKCLRRGEKVLWVSNTVGRCIELMDQCPSILPIVELRVKPLIYHSRFKHKDRVPHHEAIISAFEGGGPTLAFTTQVCEMSLDISADLLVSDLAPVSSLIQRLGRHNRRSKPQLFIPPKLCLVLVPEKVLPYSNKDLDEACTWLTRLGESRVSQRDLIRAWVQPSRKPTKPIRSTWLDGDFSTKIEALRELSYGITVVLPEDVEAVRSGELSTAEVVIQMTPPPGKADAWKDWPTVRYCSIPPEGLVLYDPARGAQWFRIR